MNRLPVILSDALCAILPCELIKIVYGCVEDPCFFISIVYFDFFPYFTKKQPIEALSVSETHQEALTFVPNLLSSMQLKETRQKAPYANDLFDLQEQQKEEGKKYETRTKRRRLEQGDWSHSSFVSKRAVDSVTILPHKYHHNQEQKTEKRDTNIEEKSFVNQIYEVYWPGFHQKNPWFALLFFYLKEKTETKKYHHFFSFDENLSLEAIKSQLKEKRGQNFQFSTNNKADYLYGFTADEYVYVFQLDPCAVHLPCFSFTRLNNN